MLCYVCTALMRPSHTETVLSAVAHLHYYTLET